MSHWRVAEAVVAAMEGVAEDTEAAGGMVVALVVAGMGEVLVEVATSEAEAWSGSNGGWL